MTLLFVCTFGYKINVFVDEYSFFIIKNFVIIILGLMHAATHSGSGGAVEGQVFSVEYPSGPMR